MNKSICFIGILFLFAQCKNAIRNESASLVLEAGTDFSANKSIAEKNIDVDTLVGNYTALYGFWVGYFENAESHDESNKAIYADEGFIWNRQNKINISIDKIEGEKVTGHSVVAGNDRPFSGIVKIAGSAYLFEVKEPGDDKYDGTFSFKITNGKLEGTWQAYKKIEISKRKYELEKKVFKYNPDVMMDEYKPFVDWQKSVVTDTWGDDDGYTEIIKEFATSTQLIYKVNASNTLLKKEDVANMKKGDLLVIRNAIYARHGYSFKNRPLRVFFDSQDWYIPVHTDIKKDFTEIEKKNIELLLRYEKNAKEYYDYFGRG
ncbi:MAG: YARHG domain-containing protein [Bacteroidia bacterium]|jgi:hypothetical protein